MKAAIFHKYDDLDSLEVVEMEKPIPKDQEVLIKVRASSVNSWDGDILKGIPLANRLQFGLSKPRKKILGCDVAGKVEQVGKKVKQVKPGDEVFGDLSSCGMGTMAEYVCAPEKMLAIKPEGMTFEQAAALPHTGVLALQALRYKGNVLKGQKVLINGAGGGSGTFALQIAKHYGAEVTCVDRELKFNMLRSLGADHVIDYTREDISKTGQLFDQIIDVVSYRSIFEFKPILSPKGVYVMLGGGDYSKVFEAFWSGPIITLTQKLPGANAGKKMGILIHRPNKKDLNSLSGLFTEGKIAPVIDKTYALGELIEAFRYYEEGLAQGKVLISI